MISGRIGSALLLASTAACFSVLVNLYLSNAGTFSQPPGTVFVEVPDGHKTPTMRLKSERAPNGEWLLRIETSNFALYRTMR